MIGLGELREPWHSTQVKLMERHLWLINVYSQARHNLFQYKGELLPAVLLCLDRVSGSSPSFLSLENLKTSHEFFM